MNVSFNGSIKMNSYTSMISLSLMISILILPLYVSFYNMVNHKYMKEKELFWCQIFKMEYLMDLHILRTSQSGNHNFSVWSICVCLCVLLDKWKKKKKNYSKNFKFGILIFFFFFVDNAWNFSRRPDKNSVFMDIQKNSNTLGPMDEISCLFILVYLDCTKCNELNMNFYHS